MRSAKKVLLFSLLCLLAVSCKKDPPEPDFDVNKLKGRWVNGSEFWRYDADGTGVTWDTADNVYEEEAQAFKWEFDDESNTLTQIHWMEMTGDWTIPRVYTVTELNDNKLSYFDVFGTTYSFIRTN